MLFSNSKTIESYPFPVVVFDIISKFKHSFQDNIPPQSHRLQTTQPSSYPMNPSIYLLSGLFIMASNALPRPETSETDDGEQITFITDFPNGDDYSGLDETLTSFYHLNGTTVDLSKLHFHIPSGCGFSDETIDEITHGLSISRITGTFDIKSSCDIVAVDDHTGSASKFVLFDLKNGAKVPTYNLGPPQVLTSIACSR